MLPKSARLVLFAAVLASAHAQGAAGSSSGTTRRTGACTGGRVTNAVEASAFVGCRVVSGDLTVEGSTLSDLSAFSELRSVSGVLTIRDNPKLRNLDGLERLERVTALTVRANGLYGTRGIESLRSVGTLVIASNRLLISLRGFRNLARVDALVVSHNPRLSAQPGLFPGLARVDRHLRVTSNLGLSRDEVAALFARTRGEQP